MVEPFNPRKLRGKRFDEVKKKVCESLSKGHRREQAFIRAGISRGTMMTWQKHYQEEVEAGLEDTVLISFWRAVLEAEADAEADIIEILRNSALEGNIKSSMYILDKRYGWAGKKEVELSTKEDDEIKIQIVGMTDPHISDDDNGSGSGNDTISTEMDQ